MNDVKQSYLFLMYPKCSTCQKAKRFLDEHNVNYILRDIVENPPTVAEFKKWLNKGDAPLKKLWNTSGQKYRALKLKERIPEMSLEECLELLASDGMLVKRPLLIGDDTMLIGFKQAEWETLVNAE